jgi:hypothetical protein
MLALATRLRAMSDADLRHVIEVRGISTGSIRDFFDLADAFLEPNAVQQACARLDRGTLAVLAVAGELSLSAPTEHSAPALDEIREQLTLLGGSPRSAAHVAERAAALDALLLARLDGDRLSPYEAVTARLRSWPDEGLPGAAELASPARPPGLASVTGTDHRFIDRLAAQRAFATVSRIAELVSELTREPARELSRGGLGLPDTKRLAQAMSVDPDAVTPLFAIAERSALIARDSGHWLETEAGEAWLLLSTTERWANLAAAWLAALPAEVRGILPRQAGLAWGEGMRNLVAWLYPAGGKQVEDRVTRAAHDAELIGITAHHSESTAGAAVLAGDLAAARATMAAALPAEVGKVYLQHDLSIVSPGPLTPSIDARLRRLADVESRELASSYRISAESLNRALASGEDARSLLDFLRSISLTGIPQPLEYLVVESASRYGRVRVGPAGPDGSSSYVRSDDPGALGTIAVDQTLAPLALIRDGDRLISRFAAGTVFWALSDAKYPVAAENAEGEIVHLRRHRVTQPSERNTVDPAAALVEKLRAGDGGDDETGHAWLARQLDVAIRTKQTVTVSVAMPGGTVVDYLLEPASVGGGRFRARDRRADIERTLPLSSVISITPAP